LVGNFLHTKTDFSLSRLRRPQSFLFGSFSNKSSYMTLLTRKGLPDSLLKTCTSIADTFCDPCSRILKPHQRQEPINYRFSKFSSSHHLHEGGIDEDLPRKATIEGILRTDFLDQQKVPVVLARSNCSRCSCCTCNNSNTNTFSHHSETDSRLHQHRAKIYNETSAPLN